MGISFAINVLDLAKGIWNFIKNNKKEEKPSPTPIVPMPSEEEMRQEFRKRIEEQIKILSGKNKTLHSLAIRELERIAENPDMNQELKQYICESFCQYLSKHPDSRPAFDALFKRDRIFVAMEKEIKGAKFIKLKLSSSHTIENVNFLNCEFHDCHFHNIHFRNFNMHGGVIRKSDFKDEIKFSDSFFKDVRIDNSYFRHAIFSNLAVREGKMFSSVILRSELRGVSFIDVEMENMAFQLCKFKMEDFSRCLMNKVYFEFRHSEQKELELMLEYLIHMGYHPCVERGSMTLIV